MESHRPIPGPRTPAPYASPVVMSRRPDAAPPVLLACTGRFNCEPVVGYPCCKPNVHACNGCQP